ncbi:hypothetical protein FJ414_31195 [Mesorhizobium sp. B3-1-6]|uniref:hypothetical protein n=1 Tax=Mesorhizobium sp. B3-1-6 TaxID=2589895 RepID=UPI00112C2F94|nr:hypothetical protein [Mesorhizobium sp. B3-1-6]TPI24332.1 hypothetical protein FJ414_31195 [Mesorhizobium sp. B3-1-6]
MSLLVISALDQKKKSPGGDLKQAGAVTREQNLLRTSGRFRILNAVGYERELVAQRPAECRQRRKRMIERHARQRQSHDKG